MLWGRRQQCTALDGLLAEVRAGRSQVLVIRGEAGIGKTALLDYAAETASDFRAARAEGVESEMELPFAALHQLCGPMLSRLGRLPGPQREALGVAFGLCPGGAPDHFLVGLAVLGLLSEVARTGCCAWSMMRSGWTRPRRRRWRSWPAGLESVALLFGTRDPPGAATWRACPGWRSRDWPMRMPGRCWPRSSRGGWMSGSGTGSSPSPAATRWPCSSCPAG
jgi:hypothetical protein